MLAKDLIRQRFKLTMGRHTVRLLVHLPVIYVACQRRIEETHVHPPYGISGNDARSLEQTPSLLN